MEAERALSYIGIAKKAGKLISGAPAVTDALRRGGKNAVFAAAGISQATEKRLCDKCSFYGARLIRLSCDGGELAKRIGKTGFVAAVMITDEGLSRAAEKAASEKSPE